MKLLNIAVYFVFFSITIAILFLLFGQKQTHLDNRNTLRLSDLNQYANIIEKEALSQNGLIPGSISALPRQIGTAETDCQLLTKHCTIISNDCIGPNDLEATASGFLSADINSGTSERTKYSVQLVSPTTIELTACDDEIDEPIKITREITVIQ